MTAKQTHMGIAEPVGVPDEEVVTVEVCSESDIQEGQVMEVQVCGQTVLLVRSGGVLSALGSRCTHYGAPLSTGVLSGGRLRCPWHGACFDVLTGDIEEYPGLDCLPLHKVTVENNQVFVSAKVKALKQTKRVKEMHSQDPGVTHTVLLIGGGPAALICAETLRQEKYGGRIVMVTKDDLPPYDRTKLSKVMNVEDATIILRQVEFLHQYGIEVWLKKEVKSVDSAAKTVTLDDGSVHRYDQLLIATGCRPRLLNCPGADLQNVRMLRNPNDAREIHHASVNRHAVIVGASFIGMEVASCLADVAASVTLIGSSRLPYERTLGPEVGKVTMQMLAEKNVRFYMNDRVTELRGQNGTVSEVVLKSGVVLPASIVVVGIGVIPNAEFLEGSSVEMDSKGAVIVDRFMKTNIPDIFGAGDVTAFPLPGQDAQRVSLGHWQLAQAQGRVAAFNMLDRPLEMSSVPFFWTVLSKRSIRYVGHGEGHTEVVLKGNVEELKFLAFYIKADDVVAAASLNFDPAISQLAERMQAGKRTTRAQATSEDLSWLKPL
ncbi:apoptosis inducing factor mitochondria associated 4 [Brienomyrus brachyistius]|uniref:apoptosis inducing factor mitochondria associated 4 n=1 Tax=Brienomyrus brachyistius TaxID=42636 RepID=UPI0020B1E911|nr:apoptosis inducing factor mitochondria associated 4 [Brienomyrus brachyistius]